MQWWQHSNSYSKSPVAVGPQPASQCISQRDFDCALAHDATRLKTAHDTILAKMKLTIKVL